MRVAQTTNKKLVFAVLLSALTVGLMLTLGRVPLAVSQPVTIPAKTVKAQFRWTVPILSGRACRELSFL